MRGEGGRRTDQGGGGPPVATVRWQPAGGGRVLPVAAPKPPTEGNPGQPWTPVDDTTPPGPEGEGDIQGEGDRRLWYA